MDRHGLRPRDDEWVGDAAPFSVLRDIWAPSLRGATRRGNPCQQIRHCASPWPVAARGNMDRHGLRPRDDEWVGDAEPFSVLRDIWAPSLRGATRRGNPCHQIRHCASPWAVAGRGNMDRHGLRPRDDEWVGDSAPFSVLRDIWAPSLRGATRRGNPCQQIRHCASPWAVAPRNGKLTMPDVDVMFCASLNNFPGGPA
jgi:hypothetical protein